MFTLLVGCPPFWHRKQMIMLRNIMEGKYSFTSPEWADITGIYYCLLKYNFLKEIIVCFHMACEVNLCLINIMHVYVCIIFREFYFNFIDKYTYILLYIINHIIRI